MLKDWRGAARLGNQQTKTKNASKCLGNRNSSACRSRNKAAGLRYQQSGLEILRKGYDGDSSVALEPRVWEVEEVKSKRGEVIHNSTEVREQVQMEAREEGEMRCTVLVAMYLG